MIFNFLCRRRGGGQIRLRLSSRHDDYQGRIFYADAPRIEAGRAGIDSKMDGVPSRRRGRHQYGMRLFIYRRRKSRDSDGRGSRQRDERRQLFGRRQGLPARV